MLAACADALMKRLREILTEAQVYELGEEVQSRVKKDEFGYGMLFMNGYIYGEKNPNLKEQDFVRRKRKIRRGFYKQRNALVKIIGSYSAHNIF